VRRARRGQLGQSMTEFIIVTPVMLMLVLGGLQFAFIYQAKITLNYAVFEAARSGAVRNADRTVIENGLARGLAPIYTFFGANTNVVQRVAAVQNARNRVIDDIRGTNARGRNPQLTPFACIQQLSPTPAAFRDHGVTIPIQPTPVREIPNDNLLYRPPRVGSSGLSVQDANLLKLRVTYCYPLIVPVIDRMITSLALGLQGPFTTAATATPAAAPGLGAFQRACYQANRLPIVAQSVVRMQSPARINAVPFPASCS
jgi:hypothetical protein